MNKVWLRGNLTRDPELRENQNGKQSTRFNIGVRRDFKNANGEYDSDFLNCVAYGNMAETINKYFHKGSGILITGHIQTGSYDKEDGTRVKTTDIVVESMEFDRSSSNKEEKEEEKPKQKLSDEPFEDFGRKVEQEELPW